MNQPSTRHARSFQPTPRAAKPASNYTRYVILAVIATAMLTVLAATLIAIFVTPERLITSHIESLTRDYYENYFYDTIGSHNDATTDRASILATYEQSGFASLTLRQLLYFDDGRHLDERSSLETYCDLSTTTVRIYPEPPFGRTDYHVNYRYSCDF